MDHGAGSEAFGVRNDNADNQRRRPCEAPSLEREMIVEMKGMGIGVVRQVLMSVSRELLELSSVTRVSSRTTRQGLV